MNSFSHNYLCRLKEAFELFPHDEFHSLIGLLVDAFTSGKQVFIMGNGGSGSIASHWVSDLNKKCFTDSKRFRAICLNENIPAILAYANDLDFNYVFVEQLKNFFMPGDIVIGISWSGNSRNVLEAVAYARCNSGITIGVSGSIEGRLSKEVVLSIIMKADDMQKGEDLCMILAHMSMQQIVYELNKSN